MTLKNTAAQKIANGILSVQKRFADVMSATTMKWKTNQQLIFLYLVCVVLGGLSIVSVIQPFKNKNILNKPGVIHIPKLFRPDEERIIITDNEIMRVHAFKQRLDSISKSKEGKVKVDRFLNERPGLFDSLEKVEQLYYSQKK